MKILASAAAISLAAVPALADSADPIKLTLHDWSGQLITTTLMGEVLKAGGHNVEYVQADYIAQFAGLETGDLHVAMEIWETTGREAMDAATATGKVVNLGSTGMDAIEWAMKAVKLGAGEIVLNSIDADGTKAGYDLEITRRISENVSVPVVASGGAGKLEHMVDVLHEGKADAVLAASIFHFGEYTVGEVKKFLGERGIPVRLR